MRRIFCLLLVLSTGQAGAQTTIDLGRQARNVDFSKSMSTRPVKVGSILPSTCVTGELFFHTASSSAQVIYACTATNIWTRQQGDTWPSNTGFLSQSVDGTKYGRSLVAGTAVIVANGDGEAGNPTINADIATKTEAETGAAANKLVTPERTRQSFEMWNPIPSQAGMRNALLGTDGMSAAWTYKLTIPASGVQELTAASAVIQADRYTVQVSPTLPTILTSTPSISSGDDGQYVCVLNVGIYRVTLQDETQLSGSALRLNAPTLAIDPNESVCFVYSTAVNAWIRANKDVAPAGGAGNVTGPETSITGRMAVFDGESGKAIKEAPAASGVLYATAGIPSVITGAAGDCITVGGTTKPCDTTTATGDVTGPATAVSGRIAVFNGTTGKAITGAPATTGVLYTTSGVPSVITGTAGDCITVGGTTRPCDTTTGDVTGPATAVSGRLTVFNGTTGKAITQAPAATGVLYTTSGVPSVITGAAGDCITVGGTTKPCTAATGDVTGPTTAVSGRLAVFDGATGKAIKEASSATGILYAAAGIPSVVAGPASDCIKVDGSTTPCAATTSIYMTERVPLPAASVNSAGTAHIASGWVSDNSPTGPALAAEATYGQGSLSFTDTTAGETWVNLSVPPGFDATTTPTVHLTYTVTSAWGNNTTARMFAQITCVAVGGTPTQGVYGNASSVTGSFVPSGGTDYSVTNSTGGSIVTPRTVRLSSSSFSGHGCEADSAMWLKVWRDSTDTYTGYIYLHRADVDFKVKLQ